MGLVPGTRLGPYEVVSPLGAGGMGEVYTARDTRLGRTVAIKVLPPEFASNPQLISRFEREAKTISQLNHPHICTLHDVGQHEGIHYLVMELVEGETLAARLARGPLPLPDVIRYGSQIAAALHRAHTAGIIHRDLKPGNVMLTKSGAKLLDFGLARPTVAPALDDALTAHAPVTSQGMILGTLPYMAPEQLQGAAVDARADIFALGAVLYEMITGRRAFDAPSSASLIAQILEHQPPTPSELQPITPVPLEHLVMTCLQKDPDERFQCAGDIAHELRWIGANAPQTRHTAIPAGWRRRSFGFAALTVAVLIAAAAIAAYRLGRRATPELSVSFTQLTFDAGAETHPAISPDGRMFAFVKSVEGQRDIFLQRVDGRTAMNLTKDSPANDGDPAFSPDGNQIAFRSERAGGGIYLMGVWQMSLTHP